MAHDGTQEEKDALEQEGIRIGVLGPNGNVNGVDPDTLARRVAFVNPFFDSPYIDAIPGIDGMRSRAEAREQDAPPPADDMDDSDGGYDAPVERKKPPAKPNPPKAPKPPHKGGHYVKIFAHDADLIINKQDPAAVNALALWYVLCREARHRQSYTFEASDGYLAKTKVPKGMASDKTVQRAAKLLHSLGLLESKASSIPGMEIRTPLKRTIRPAGELFKASGCKEVESNDDVDEELDSFE